MHLPPRSNLCALNIQATLWRPRRLRLLQQGGEASTMTGSEASTQWNGAILPLLMLGAGRKSSITQSSSFFLWLSMGDLSGPRGRFMSAHTKCPGARKSTKKKSRLASQDQLKKNWLCYCQATVSCRFQIRFCILTSVQLVLLRTYCLKQLSQTIM